MEYVLQVYAGQAAAITVTEDGSAAEHPEVDLHEHTYVLPGSEHWRPEWGLYEQRGSVLRIPIKACSHMLVFADHDAAFQGREGDREGGRERGRGGGGRERATERVGSRGKGEGEKVHPRGDQTKEHRAGRSRRADGKGRGTSLLGRGRDFEISRVLSGGGGPGMPNRYRVHVCSYVPHPSTYSTLP